MSDEKIPAETAEGAPETPTLFDVQEMELNFGPQHPSTHGVLRIVQDLNSDRRRKTECSDIPVRYLVAVAAP